MVKRKWAGRTALLYSGVALSAGGVVGLLVGTFFVLYRIPYLPQIGAFIIVCFVLDKIFFFFVALGDAIHQWKHVAAVPDGTMKSILTERVLVHVEFIVKVPNEAQKPLTSNEYTPVAGGAQDGI